MESESYTAHHVWPPKPTNQNRFPAWARAEKGALGAICVHWPQFWRSWSAKQLQVLHSEEPCVTPPKSLVALSVALFSFFQDKRILAKQFFPEKNMEKVFQGSTIKIKQAVPTSHQIGCTTWKQSGFRVSMRYNIHSLLKATNNPIWSNEITSLVATPNVIPWIRTDCWILLLPSDHLTWAIMDGSAKNPPPQSSVPVYGLYLWYIKL